MLQSVIQVNVRRTALKLTIQNLITTILNNPSSLLNTQLNSACLKIHTLKRSKKSIRSKVIQILINKCVLRYVNFKSSLS
jgi:hypothetical protein